MKITPRRQNECVKLGKRIWRLW